MSQKASLSQRWKNFEPTKKFLFWTCVSCVALTILVGFKWGGWVTGGAAEEMAATAAAEARIELAVASCILRFNQGNNVSERLDKLKKIESWKRGGFIEKTGWATPVGADDPIDGAGERCAERLLNAETVSAKTTN